MCVCGHVHTTKREYDKSFHLSNLPDYFTLLFFCQMIKFQEYIVIFDHIIIWALQKWSCEKSLQLKKKKKNYTFTKQWNL